MPKTAVHKSRQARFGEDEVRFSKYFLVPSPASNFVLAKEIDEGKFSGFVPVTTNFCHELGTIALGIPPTPAKRSMNRNIRL